MEDKDIIIIQELIESKNGELLNCWDYGEEAKKSLEKLLQAYKQDEKVIEEMAKYIDFDKMNFNCGMCVHDGCQEKCIIDYFRKKCE